MARTETPMTAPALKILRGQLSDARKLGDRAGSEAMRASDEASRLQREADGLKRQAEMFKAEQERQEAVERELEQAILALTGEEE